MAQGLARRIEEQKADATMKSGLVKRKKGARHHRGEEDKPASRQPSGGPKGRKLVKKVRQRTPARKSDGERAREKNRVIWSLRKIYMGVYGRRNKDGQ